MRDFIMHTVWLTLSMSLVILLVMLFSRCLGNRFSAKSRYTIWTVVLLSLFFGIGLFKLPSLVTFNISMPSFFDESTGTLILPPINDETQLQIPETQLTGNSPNSITPSTNHSFANEYNSTLSNIPKDTSAQILHSNQKKETIQIELIEIIFAVWITGAVIYFAISIMVYVRSVQKFTRAKKICGVETENLLCVMCQRYKIRHAPRIYLCSEVGSPILYGYTNPTILIPEMPLTRNALVSILAHELTHYRRGDIWVKLICLITESLYWFNPLVHLAAQRCNTEMELSCDETVLAGRSVDIRRSYGGVMLDIVEHCTGKRSLLTTQFNPRKDAVKERIMNILDMTTKKQGRALIASTLILCIIAGTFIGCAVRDNSDKKEGTINTIDTPIAYSNLTDFLTDEQIATYKTASILYPMFQGMPTEIDNLHLSLIGADMETIIAYLADNNALNSRNSYTIDGVIYQATIGEYTTFSKLEELCISVFTETYFDKLNRSDEKYSIFKEIEGRLYYLDTAKGGAFGYVPDEYPDTYELTSRTDTEICFNVIGHYKNSGGGDQIYSVGRYAFPITMVLQDDGWRFSQFADAGISDRDINKPEEVILKVYFGQNSIDDLMEQTVTYQKEEIKLGDWFKKYEFWPIKYTTLDLNDDGASEMVFGLAKGPNGENTDVGSLILHNEGETVYAYILFIREFSQLKSDGTFHFSSSVSNGGIGKIDFSGASYTVKEIVRRKSEDNQTLFYYIDDQAVSKVEYDTYIAEQEQKSEAVWEYLIDNDSTIND